MNEKNKPVYSPGDKVTTLFAGIEIFIIKNKPTWNGLTWMYDFHGTPMRCGEDYLCKILTDEKQTH